MLNNASSFSKIIKLFKKEALILLIFILITDFSQALILKPHLDFGFSPDDVWLISDFSFLGPNPFSKLPLIYEKFGSHVMSPLYYNGVLFSFFGFNFQLYQISALIFKILSIICFYILIQILFRKRFLSFMSGLIFSFHYASVGGLEMVTRTQDYLVISAMNIFLILFFLTNTKKLNSLFWQIITALVLATTFFINPIRAFPLIPFIAFISLIIYSKYKTKSSIYLLVRSLLIYSLPFIIFLSLMPHGSSGISFGNFFENIRHASKGNLQLLFTPFATLGSVFLIGDSLKFLSFSFSVWNFSHYFSYLLSGPSISLGLLTIILSFIISKKPWYFFLRVFLTNFILEFLFFYIIGSVVNLSPDIAIHYDPSFLVPPTILGIYVTVLTIFIFIEWLHQKENTYLSLYLLGISFSIIFIWFTWIFQDYISTPLGIHGYTTIPSIGISASLGSILLLAYTKLKSGNKFTQSLAPVILLPLILYFLFSNNQIQTFLTRNLYGGNNAKDQIYFRDKFWQLVKNPESCNKLFFLETNRDLTNGSFYNYIMIDRFDRWYNLYSPYRPEKPCPVGLIVNDKKKLISSYVNSSEKTGFSYQDFKGEKRFSTIENFFAFRLQDREIKDIKSEILVEISR